MTLPIELQPVAKYARLSDCGAYRYTLGRIWDDTRHVLPIIMLNPSTADHKADDPTINRCMFFARRDGYGGIEVRNLYALRTPHPKVLFELAGNGDDVIGPDNNFGLRSFLWAAKIQGVPVWCAWGNNAQEARATWFRDFARRYGVDLVHLGTTLSGAPKHPLARGHHRIANDQPFIPFS